MMTEMIFLPLKSAGGTILGHARIANGICRLHLRRAVRGQAVILGDEGTWFGAVQEEIGVRGRLCAVAVLEEGRLLCCGAPQGQPLDFCALQQRLERDRSIPSAKAAPVRTAEAEEMHVQAEPSLPKAAPEPPMKKLPPLPADPPQAEVCPVRETKPRVIRTARRPRRPRTPLRPASDAHAVLPVFTEGAPFLSQSVERVTAERSDMEPPSEVPAAAVTAAREAPENLLLFDGRNGLHAHAPSLADSTADSEAFAALMRRAELVFESIESPQPPLRSVSGQGSPSDLRTDGSTVQRSWGEEVERLLGERPAPTKTPIDNPFPHIFPNAVFHRIGGSGTQQHLEGTWQSGSERLRIYAVPGSYSLQPPAHLRGYTRFIRTQQGSYWVRVTGDG